MCLCSEELTIVAVQAGLAPVTFQKRTKRYEVNYYLLSACSDAPNSDVQASSAAAGQDLIMELEPIRMCSKSICFEFSPPIARTFRRFFCSAEQTFIMERFDIRFSDNSCFQK